MVKALIHIISFFRLIRFQNLLIVAITQIFLRYFIIIPLLGVQNFESQLSTKYFFFILLATVFITAGGYVINDYFDRKTDLINRPDKVIVGRLITRRAAMIWHIILNAIGILLGVWASYKLGLLKVSIVYILASGLLWFYSTTYKKQVVLGNLIVAFMVALVPMILLLYEMPLLLREYEHYLIALSLKLDFLIAWIVAYSVFAFLLTLMREIVKDSEDFEGDTAFGRQSIPIKWGIGTTRYILLVIDIFTIVPILLLLFLYLPDLVSMVYIIVFVVIPLIIFAFALFYSNKVKDFHRLSGMLKIIMLTGLLYCPVAFIIINKLT